MAKRELSTIRTAVRRLCGQSSMGPSGVAAQSCSAIRAAISPRDGGFEPTGGCSDPRSVTRCSVSCRRSGEMPSLEVSGGVDRRPVDAGLEVQVVAEAVARAAHVADDLALGDAGPVGGAVARLVGVTGRQPARVLDAGG